MRCQNVDNPVRRKGCDAEHNEERNEVGTLCADLRGPKFKPGLEGRKGEQSRAESSGDEVAK
jgi:hypothetical protein